MTRLAPSLTLAPFLLVLAACGGKEPQEDAAPAPEATATEAALPAPAAEATEPGTIPAAFHGVWDAETGTCDPASDMMLRIAPDGIGFYESHGSVTRVTEGPDGRATLDLAMEGEGDRWDTTMTLNLTGQGADERLLVPFEDSEGKPAPLTLKRCPA